MFFRNKKKKKKNIPFLEELMIILYITDVGILDECKELNILDNNGTSLTTEFMTYIIDKDIVICHVDIKKDLDIIKEILIDYIHIKTIDNRNKKINEICGS